MIMVVAMTRSSGKDGLRPRMSVHPGLGHRYEHADLTAHPYKNRKRRRVTLLVQRAVDAMVRRYAVQLDAEVSLFEDFAHEVGRRLRREVRPEWSAEEAERRAIVLAEALFAELDPSMDGTAEDSDEDEPGEDPPGTPGGSPGEA